MVELYKHKSSRLQGKRYQLGCLPKSFLKLFWSVTRRWSFLLENDFGIGIKQLWLRSWENYLSSESHCLLCIWGCHCSQCSLLLIRCRQYFLPSLHTVCLALELHPWHLYKDQAQSITPWQTVKLKVLIGGTNSRFKVLLLFPPPPLSFGKRLCAEGKFRIKPKMGSCHGWVAF